MRLLLLALPIALLSACDAYDPSLIRPDGGSGEGGDDDAGEGECRVVPDSDCAQVCLERCNGLDDDCDGVIDNNGASSSCRIPNAEATCNTGECLLVRCEEGFADCNDDPSDGCEVSLEEDPTSCGLCGAECSFLNAEPMCMRGTCVKGDCNPGFGDCDHNPGNGCETSLRTLMPCGSCTGRCVVGDNALPTCDTGTCEIAVCVGNFADCNGDITDGCEQALDDPQNCGECGVDCADLPNATATCGEMSCEGVTCIGDFQNCDGIASNGCEALLNSPLNCGACGMTCDLPNVSAHVCDVTGAATCGIDDSAPNGGCDAGYADCNHNPADGCERPLNTIDDCGACGAACEIDNAIATCATGTCEFSACAPGFEDCDMDGECESLIDDPSNCGGCGNVCTGTTLNCSGGRCRLTSCPSGEADCDDNDTCEPLNTAANCGSCGVACPATLANGTGSCSSGGCMVTCNAGFANCNGNPLDGCETNIRTLTNCGGCGVTCAIANAEATCATGSCRVADCNPTHEDCNNDMTSCETSLSLPTSCGGCTTNCTGRPHTSAAGCDNGRCSFTCEAGYRDCNMMASDGCEADIGTAAHCGMCNNNCASLPNVAAATCNGTSCNITTCNAGFANCDGLPGNGCERSITTLSDCGGCNMPCSRPNATATCSSAGACTMGACNAGFGDCDNNPANGCELQLNTTTNCGMCGRACTSGQTCNNGTCQNATCPTGQSFCGGSTCVDIRGGCTPWPCLNKRPGPKTNCGGCGQMCQLYNGDCCLSI